MDQLLLLGKKCLFLILLLSSAWTLEAQTFATTINSEDEVDNSTNAIDGDLSTSANVRASSGLALGVGAYDGHLELEFPSTLTSNTQSFVKIETEDDLLPSLLGGSLGSLLSNVLGVVLIGNQQFIVTVKNNDNNVLQESSFGTNAFSSDQLRVVTDANNDFYLAIAPEDDYNRVRIENQIGSVLGLFNTRSLDVFGAFYGGDPSLCGTPSYTSFDGSGLSLDLLGLGGAGVTNPNLAIDGDLNTASEVGLGVLGVAASIEQTVYFDSLSQPGDNFYVRLAVDPSLLTLGVADNIQVIAQNGSESPIFSGNLSALLDLDLLGLLEGGQVATIPLDPSGQANRVTFRLSSLLNVDIAQSFDLYEVYRAPALPELDASSQDVSICTGESVDLVATTAAGNELRWYDSETNGNLLATVNSGDPYTTPVLTASTTYYVAAANPSCPEESPRIPVEVNVVDIPTAADIDIIGDESPICSSNNVVLTPSSDIDGTYTWFFDANATNEITDGLTVGAVTYTIDPEDGALIISGLDQGGSPYTYYARVTESSAGCENAAGDLQSATVQIVDSGASIAIDATPVITLDILSDIFQVDPTFNVSGSISGDASPGDAIILSVNGQTFNGVLDANLDFSVDVNGIDLSLDANSAIEVFVDGGLCSLTGGIDIDIPDLIIDDLVQTFCASDNPTLLDLVVNVDNIAFFDSLDAALALDLGTPLVDGEVYFAGILGVPLEVLVRVGITVNLINPSTPTASETTQTFCASENPTLADIQVNESNILFFADAGANTTLDVTTPLVDGESYFVANVSAEGCISTSLLEIIVNLEGRTPTTNSVTQTFCASAGLTLADIQVNESNILFYDSATGGQELDASTLLSDGTYYLSLEETSGCESPTRLEVTVVLQEDEPITLTGQSEDACINQEYTYTTESGKQNYSWTVTGGTVVDGGGITDDFVSVNWTSLQENSISIAYDDPAACTPSDAFELDVATIECGEVLDEEFCLMVYNEFSPNNDGFNDFFEIECIEDYSNTIEVFNRNGNTVFKAVDYRNTWNGIANVNGILNKGDHLPSGTYYYVVNIPELNRNLVGWLQLAR
ncbi:gliding motility-associated C-terminal domain-containing protein [Muricauda oceani]|uniref:T9SS type B sorting domain-containing protein n=1 Tax=Flagellimonas oceani TaxID=2698672 RepID=A0A6G7J0N0_9FLAO|nr:gliding motility-associated C-terminal domain-containing protein [Allomuricauda oceani]MBW8244190.1 gliding motility-associated C-terminal domain-containing protein [Allomuricauda oceani]QII44158.1 T9SS type B sorting domain-containing protein [Allomuricauda oceani]